MQLSILSISSYIFARIIYTRRQNYVVGFCISERKLIATRTYFHATLSKNDRFYRSASSSQARLAGMPRAGTSKAQYCFFRRFNCLPDSRSQSVVESTARRAIGGNISPRYLGAPNSTCKLISLPDSRYAWPERVAFAPCYPLSGSLIGPGTPL